jgi:hypothetical protein
MSLAEELERLSRQRGHRIVLPTPPDCQFLLAQARAAGFPVNRLFVLSRPLYAGLQGSYERSSGDLWCHYDGADEHGGRDLLQCLLTLIATVKLQLSAPATIAEDWEQACTVHREAAALAKAWQREDLFTADDLEQCLAYDRHLSLCHEAAGELAGRLVPSIAREAYGALLEVQQRYQWSPSQFAEALQGVREDDEEANAAVLDFDRCQLRARWLTSRTQKRAYEPDPFGAFALPQTPATARVLRTALAWVAHQHVENKMPQVPQHVTQSATHTFFRLECEQDLALILACVTSWLLEDFPQCYARLRWELSADECGKDSSIPSPHLYHMSVEYVSCQEQMRTNEEPSRRDLWVLVPARQRTVRVEASLQRYISSWLTCAEVYTEALYDGLQALWSWLEQDH